jgi:CHAT domain-containing protein/tetratricopeptide (TPR) repeat protein
MFYPAGAVWMVIRLAAFAAWATVAWPVAAAETNRVAAWTREAGQWREKGSYIGAKGLAEKAVEAGKGLTGTNRAERARAYRELAQVQMALHDYGPAQTNTEAALELRRQLFGEDHPETAQSLNDLALVFSYQDREKEALPLCLRGLEVRRKVLGDRHPDYASSLDTLAWLQWWLGNTDQAVALYGQVIALRKDILGDKHRDYGQSLRDLARFWQSRGEPAKALPLYEQALATYQDALGERHPEYVTLLNNVALLCKSLGRYEQALPLYRQAVALTREVLGEHDPGYLRTLNNLAGLYQSLGRYEQALPLFRQVLAARKGILGTQHPDYAVSLNNLGSLYEAMGRYDQALPLYQQAVALRKAALGEQHPDYAAMLNNLAMLYDTMGRPEQGLPLCQQALAIYKAARGERHPDYATSLHNLGALYKSMGRFARALPLYQQSLAIDKEVLGEKHPDYAIGLNNLGALYKLMDRYDQTLPLYQQALTIDKEVLGERHPSYALDLNNLGMLHVAMGRYEEARPFLEQALAIRRQILGERHPEYAISLNNLGLLLEWMGRREQALPLLRQALSVVRDHLDLAATVQSEQQQLATARELEYCLGSWLGTALRGGAKPEEMASQVLAWKGRIWERQQAMPQARAVLMAAGDKDALEVFEQLENTARLLAALALARPEADPQKSETRLLRLKQLSEQREGLEQKLASISTAYRERQKRAGGSLADVQRALGAQPGVALVDLLEYLDGRPPAAGKGRPAWEWRLVALVVRGEGQAPRAVALGPARPISTAVEAWRKTLGSGLEGRKAGQALRELVWNKIEPMLEGVRTVLISPDGCLCRLPFGALPGAKQETYLIEDYGLASVPIPRLLPEMFSRSAVPPPAQPALLAIGDVDYGCDPGRPAGLAQATAPLISQAAPRGKEDGAFAPWRKLESTRDEVLALRDSFEQRFGEGRVRLLRGSNAVEQQVRELAPKCQYLHLATHGYFADENLRSFFKRSMGAQAGEPGPFGTQDVSGWNPGLLSGLVLAGANQSGEEGKDDGILTALEVQALDLRQVELAVLSACETGLGETAGGEGLLGLQRAFQVAGARSVVASLWKVPDEATRNLMSAFYRNLWEGKKGRLEALREAQLWMMREGQVRGARPVAKGRLAPEYWAAFVLSGDWR